MRLRLIVSAAAVAASVAFIATTASSNPSGVSAGIAPPMQSIGTISFGSNNVLYTADPLAATIYALDIAALEKGAPGTKDVPALNEKLAATLGTAPNEIAITDLAVDPASKNSFVAVMRGLGADARPVIARVDGEGRISVVPLESVKFTSVTLPNPPAASTGGRSNRTQSVTDMALVDGKLWVAGLSNEEFASKLWAIPYPFQTADRGTSVEIYHGNHGGLETRSPVNAFLPFTVAGEKHIIASYTCTPLVKFPVKSLTPGAKITGTTIAELGAQNRPIDMISYRKDGKDFILMANTSRGVMKITTDEFATAPAINTRIGGTAGVKFETITSMTGVLQLDLLDATRSVVITGSSGGPLNLQTVILP